MPDPTDTAPVPVTPEVKTEVPIKEAPPSSIPTYVVENVADIDALLAASLAGKPAPKPAATAEPDPEPAPEVQAPEPTKEPEPEVAPVKEKVLPNKIGTKQFDDDEQRAIALKKSMLDAGQHITLREAFEILDSRKPKPEPVAAPQPSEVETLTAQAAEADKKLSDLRAKRKEFAANETTFTDELDQVSTQIEDTIAAKAKLDSKIELAQLKEENAKSRQRQTAHEQALTVQQEANSAAIAEFPHCDDVNHPHGQKVAELVQAWNDPKHPNHALLAGKDAPTVVSEHAARLVAKDIAAEKKIPFAEAYATLLPTEEKPVAGKVEAAKPAADKVVKFQPASGAAPTAKPVVKNPEEERRRVSNSSDPNEIDAFLGLNKQRRHLIQA